MKTNRTVAPGLLANLLGVHPSGCQWRLNSLKRGHLTAARLFFAVALPTASSLLFFPPSAHAQGGAPLWTNRYDGPASLLDRAVAIAVDSSGNVVVTGPSETSAFVSDYVTIKYSNAGVPLWTNRYDGPANGNDRARAIAVDSSGNVFVTGASSQSSTDDRDDYATVAYSSAGVPLWSNRYGPGVVSGIAVDNSGNVVVTGYSTGDYATIKYSNAGVPLFLRYPTSDHAVRSDSISKRWAGEAIPIEWSKTTI